MASVTNEATPLLENYQTTQRQSRNGWLYFAVFSAVLGNFIFGYSLAIPSAVIPQLQRDNNQHLHMEIHQISWFGSIFAIGAIAGGLTSMLINDKVGRKHSTMISVIPSMAGFLMMAAAEEWLLLYLGRLLTGIGAGITSSSIPIYVSEISHPGVRVALGSIPQVMMVLGCLALYVLGLVLPWRWLAIAGQVPGVIMVILLFFMPNSPRYLIIKGKLDEAAKALQWLRGPNSNNINELNQILESVNSQVGIKCSDLKSPFYYKPILIAVFMRFLQQMTGITPILIFLEPIFEKTAVSLEPKYDAAIVGLVRLVSAVIAVCFLDKAGRKSFLYISAFIMYLATLTLTMNTHKTSCDCGNLTAGLTSATEPIGVRTDFELSSATVIPLISIIFIVFGYSIGWGPITWLLISEILPMRVRGITSGVCVMVSYITAFVLTQVFMHAVEAYGLYALFLFFCVMSVVNIVFTGKCVPETKGRTLEEIENYFRPGHTFSIAESQPSL